MSPVALLCALVGNAVVAAGAAALCIGLEERDRSLPAAAGLASLFVTFGLARILRDRPVRVLSRRTAIFAICYPLGVAVLTSLVAVLGYFARPGGNAGAADVAAGLLFAPFMWVAIILSHCWMIAVGGGILAAVITVSSMRLFPEGQDRAE